MDILQWITEHSSGGVATFIKSNLFKHVIPLNTNLEAVAVLISLSHDITLCNVYFSNSQEITIHDIKNLIQQLPKPFIVLGDFNSHSEL